MQAKNDFMTAYNAGVYEEVFSVLGKIKSWKTIERWQKALEEANGDVTVLEPNYKPKPVAISKAEAEILLPLLLHPNGLPVSDIIRTAKMKMRAQGIAPKSDASYRRFLNNWIKNNYDLYILSREGGKAYNDKVVPYIKRDFDKIEALDIVVADGHTLNFEAINPATGKPKRMTLILFFDMKSGMPLGFEIMPTENTMAIASGLRRTILLTGIVPRVLYLDNGRAFRGKYFTGVKDFRTSGLEGLFTRLGINVIFATPYHGQSKTVERFFGVLGEFERRFETYTGYDIAHQPARLKRNEKLHRRFFSGTYPTVKEVIVNLIEFFKEYAERPHTGGFYKGRTPAEIFNESIERVKSLPDYESRLVEPKELDYLMMSEQTRVVGRNGVRLFGRYYFNEALLPIKDTVTVKYDLADLSRVLVFDRKGKFICEATDEINEAVHPAAKLLGTAEDVEKVTEKLRIKRGYEKEVKEEVKELFNTMNEITPVYAIEGEEVQRLKGSKAKKLIKENRTDDAEDYWEMWREVNGYN